MMGRLANVKLATSDYCYRCRTVCPLRPPPPPGAATANVLYVNAAGTTCVDHSSMGLRAGCMGQHILPWTTWCAERVACQETAIIHEWEAHHPMERVLQTAFGSMRWFGLPSGPRCSWPSVASAARSFGRRAVARASFDI